MISRLNDASRLSTLAYGEGIPFVDVNAAFGGDLTLLSTDGLHPNANGYQRIADTFFNSLTATLDITPASLAGVRRTVGISRR